MRRVESRGWLLSVSVGLALSLGVGCSSNDSGKKPAGQEGASGAAGSTETGQNGGAGATTGGRASGGAKQQTGGSGGNDTTASGGLSGDAGATDSAGGTGASATDGGGGAGLGTAGAAGDIMSLAGSSGASPGGFGNTAGAAGAYISLPPPIDCTPSGGPCETGETCCSRLCDVAQNTCVSQINICLGAGAPCDVPTDCCTLSCVDGRCNEAGCTSDNETCSSDEECCSGTCDGECVPLNVECKTAGNSCTADGECCSTLCTSGTCQLGASYCIQQGDICSADDDCCAGVCIRDDGATVGTCAAPPSASANCTGVDGMVCTDCGDCCSALCVPYGPSGVKVCQPATGCHVTGELCREDKDCCGGDADSGLPGAGNVQCDKADGATIGRCNNGQGCTPQGGVCHFKGYACDVSAKNAACCGATGASSGACQLDTLGVPRCFAVDECRQEGDTCSSAADCCDGLPCVPDEEGTLRCYQPPEGTCVPTGGPCTVNADCCPGTQCIRPPGSVIGECGVPTVPGTGGSGGTGSGGEGGESVTGGTGGQVGTGGTPATGGAQATGGAAPVCSEYGQSCTTTADCCNDVTCTNGRCVYPF